MISDQTGDYDVDVETLEILQDTGLVADIRAAELDRAVGKSFSLEEVRLLLTESGRLESGEHSDKRK